MTMTGKGMAIFSEFLALGRRMLTETSTNAPTQRVIYMKTFSHL